MGEYEHLSHTAAPVYDKDSRILILGTFPSVKSREKRFFYGHPRNRFWNVLSGLVGNVIPETIEEKKTLLLQKHIALWDVIESCDIIGSSDSSIKNVVPANIESILKTGDIRAIYGNGGTACRLYMKHQYVKTGIEIIPLPSTSPANASYSLERLMDEWSVILEHLENK